MLELNIDLKKIFFDEGSMDLPLEKRSRSSSNEFEVTQKFVDLIAETIE